MEISLSIMLNENSQVVDFKVKKIEFLGIFLK